jgi:hypothetical protein
MNRTGRAQRGVVTGASAARLLLGGALLARPHGVLRVIDGPDRDDDLVQTVARVLGARLVLQGLGDLVLGQRLRKVDLAIECAHAASMLPVAARWPRHRRSALVSAAMATGIGLLDLASARRSGPT